MNNVEKLYDIQKCRQKISKQEELIQYYETMSHSLGGGGFEEKVQCTPSFEAPFVKWIYKKIDAESVLKVMKENLKIKIDEMLEIIERVDNIDYRKILTYRYIQNKDWEFIFNSLYLGSSTTYRYHKLALKALNSIDEKRES